ncbi:hypothetical protein [Actinoplanes xinjiangensis]|uniref:Uncharacterized protein n=1 Tax=Actinoplanes xinjiangensis TaxID=512350 RepID=A0A316FH96_9ACTN|nr:hypothetical protein [Actinoplanes xinjiangensis]PWK47076.1 hypothetical protein BC793_108191 [Actinoplanes xinjiangensis]GIF40235.1 hypothetical protein Axi01nite_45460 [Actinoplanes xinjiangensis]
MSTSDVTFGIQAGGLLYLIMAGACLLLALQLLRRAVAPIGALVQAAAALAAMGLAVGAALVLIAAALVGGS